MFLAQLHVPYVVERLLERRRVIPRVIQQPRAGLVGEFIVANEILKPNLGGIHLQSCQYVHHTLDAVRRFGPPRTTIGVGGHAVGEDAHDVGANVPCPVKAGHHEDAERRDRRRQ